MELLVVKLVPILHCQLKASGDFDSSVFQEAADVHPFFAFAEKLSDIHDHKEYALPVSMDKTFVGESLRTEISQLFAGSVKLQDDSLAFAVDLTIL